MGTFWDYPCPARGAADLKHQHARDCNDHALGQCCECGMTFQEWADQRRPGIMPPRFSVAQRLSDMGLMTVPDREDDLVEPRYITGDGPQGSAWGLGRGELTDRQKVRVRRYVDFHLLHGRELQG